MAGRLIVSHTRLFIFAALLLIPGVTGRGEDDGAPKNGPQKLQVDFWVVEVPIDKLRSLGFEWEQFTTNGVKRTSADSIESIAEAPGSQDQFLRFLKSLEQNSLARTLCQPTLVTLDGRPASLVLHDSLEFDVVPIALGNGNVRLEYRVMISSDAPKQKGNTSSPRSASLFQSDAAVEIELGKTSLLSHTRTDRPVVEGKSQPIEVFVLARVDVLKTDSLPTGR